MGKVNVAIGGRSYPLLCGDGEEEHITALAAVLQGKADGLTTSLGTMSEPRLLLMAGLQIADELFAAKTGGGTTKLDGSSPASGDDPRYAALLTRVEALAAMLEGPGAPPVDEAVVAPR